MSDLNKLLSFDVDGYPTDSCFDEIRNYKPTDTDGPLRVAWYELMEAIAPAFEPYGRCEYRSMDNTWEVATGGWSGNESLLSALEGNHLFWALCWQLSKRGGYYEFKT